MSTSLGGTADSGLSEFDLSAVGETKVQTVFIFGKRVNKNMLIGAGCGAPPRNCLPRTAFRCYWDRQPAAAAAAAGLLPAAEAFARLLLQYSCSSWFAATATASKRQRPPIV